ncbi:hypothetical protein GCK72_017482 [Caenorhabditis remanei]|uniref:RING-type domain-containing protein n=1 Tax=Caenorhabditis remanei TaxID=31234 RepID=A0A6A5G870_CAERE|nr:hypothetical protein GCK72_017482 [Caenorhabditis remanei]KAF1750931.1 hypothetical protein GCK72_017482 [Caenorhabditis remanei]
MANLNITECIICFNEYDFETRKPCIGTCGHSICESCKHLMVTSKCPQCNRDEAFAITTINYQVLELMKQLNNMQSAEGSTTRQLLSEDLSGLDEGTCSECTLRSRKLRLCITCAVRVGILKFEEMGKKFVLNIENDGVEAALQKAKEIAICGDCALDGAQHEGHRTMHLAVLKNDLEDCIPTVIQEKMDQVQINAGSAFDELKKKLKISIDSLKIYFERYSLLPATERKIHFNNIEASIEKINDTLSLARDAVKRLEMLNSEFVESTEVVDNNMKAVTKASTAFANMEPVLVAGEHLIKFRYYHYCKRSKNEQLLCLADRKQSAREPLLIGLFNPKDNVWTSLGRIPNPKSNYAVASNKSQIFIIGGVNNGSWLQNVEMYDKNKDRRRDCKKLKRGRTRTSAGFHNNKMYVAGGYDSTYMSSVEIFDPDHGDWRDGPSLKRARADGVVVSCNGELFVLGGFNGKEYEEKIEKLNDRSQQFEEVGEMQGSRAGFAACAFRGRIYIAGGWSNSSNTLRSVRSYDPMTNSWRDEPSLNKDRKYFTLHATSKTIYAIRGCADSWSLINEVEKFDADGQKWDIIKCTDSRNSLQPG